MRPVVLTLFFIVALIAWPIAATAYDPIEWAPSLAQAQRLAKEQGRLVLIHFWSESCPPCMRLERSVFNRREFINSLQGNYVPVKVNVELRSELAHQFGIRSIPTDVIVTPDGREVHRSISPADSNRYIAMLDEVAAHHRVAQVAPPPTHMPLSETSTVGGFQSATPAADAQAAAIRKNQVVENPFARTLPAERATGHSIYSQPFGDPALQDQGQQEPAPVKTSAATQPTAENPVQGQAAAPPSVPRRSRYSDPTSPPATTPQNRTASTMPNPNTSGPPRTREPARDVQRAAANLPARAEEFRGATGLGPTNATAQPQQSTTHAADPRLQYGSNTPRGETSPGAPVVQPDNFQPTTRQPSAETMQQRQQQQVPAPIVAPTPPPVGLDGFCPVNLVEGDRWQVGDPRWQATFERRTYYFAGPREREQFLREPARYSPAMSGYDVVRYREQGVLVPGKREHGVFAKDEKGVTQGYYLFADESSLQRFCRANGQATAPSPRGTTR